MKKIFVIFLLVFSFLLLGCSVRAEQINSFDSQVLINKDGTIDVKESIVYDFDPPAGGLKKHGIYREIPFIKTNQDGNPTSSKTSLGARKYKLTFNNFSVTDEFGNDYRFINSIVNEKNIRLKIGDADELITGVYTYIISYKVAGALTYFSDHDELYWNVTGNEWNVPIASTTSQVVWPQEISKEDIKTICFTGIVLSKQSNCYLSHDRGQDKIVTKGILNEGEGLTVVVSFPKNIVAVLEPKEFIAFSDSFFGKLVGLVIGLLILLWYVVLPFFIILKWLKSGRDPSASSGQVQAWFDPPKSPKENRFLTPGEVGTLGDETVDMKDISATIVDLARRGYLVIDERKKKDFYLVRGKLDEGGPDKILPYEKIILSDFFGSKVEIRIKDEELHDAVEKVKTSLYEQIVKDGLFPKNPKTIRDRYMILAVLSLFTGNIFLSIVAFIFGRIMPRKTSDGSNAFNVAKSLKNFLASQERQLEFQADKAILPAGRQVMFEKLLPYAIAFGVEKIWAKRFESLNISQPSWYHSYSSSNFSSYMLVSSLNSSFRSVNTAATPTRSSSGFSSGFGGGGFSGGGGGGGGGGSW